MKKSLPALAACLGVIIGLAASMPAAEARDGFGGGGHPGNFGPVGRGERPNYPDRPNWNNGGNYIPFVDVDAADINEMIPENNSGSRQPNDCNYLFKKANESGDPQVWRLFNDCSHGR